MIGVAILSIPLVLYGIAYANADKVTKNVEDRSVATNLLVFAAVFVSVLFEISHHKKHGYTVHVMLAALVLIVFGGADVWTGRHALPVTHHIKSAARTAAITFLIFVISVHIVDHIPYRRGEAAVTTPIEK